MIAALEVKLVEDDSTLQLIVSLVGPLLITVAAVTAAVIAAKTAGRRQMRELAHDRDIRRDEHRRDALDDSLEVANAVRGTFTDFRPILATAEQRRSDIETALDDVEKGSAREFELREEMGEVNRSLREEWFKLLAGVEDFKNAVVRLQLRFTQEHPVTKGALAFLQAWEGLERALRPLLLRNMNKTVLDDSENANAAAREAYGRFMDTCSAWLTGKLDTEG